MHPALYRSYQFFAAVKASLPRQLSPADTALMRAVLPAPAQQELFNRMPPNDRRHAIAVARTLQQAGHTEPALLQAALLHDVAKSIGQPILHRVAIVLFEAFWPAALRALSDWQQNDAAPSFADSQIRGIVWWRRPFVVHAHHPAIGAAWAKRAGCDSLAVTLILNHQQKPAAAPATAVEKLQAALYQADNLN
ncbi:MAG: hypothetical protein FOGNACKC_04666 [Anaerolineae bacterium]|nr:hypothetical protein [Anaerolineae bacterium]